VASGPSKEIRLTFADLESACFWVAHGVNFGTKETQPVEFADRIYNARKNYKPNKIKAKLGEVKEDINRSKSVANAIFNNQEDRITNLEHNQKNLEHKQTILAHHISNQDEQLNILRERQMLAEKVIVHHTKLIENTNRNIVHHAKINALNRRLCINRIH